MASQAVQGRHGRLRRSVGAPSVVLFLCMFAAQAALLVLSPILPRVAADLGVTTSTAAQLRSVSGIVAGGVAVWLAMWAPRRALRPTLAAGLLLLAASTAASAAAPTFAVLAAAQVGVGVALALLLSGALTAAGEWTPATQSKTLSWALVGQPAAWIVGMPLAGAVAVVSWRYAWLALPFAASVVALVALSARPADPAVQVTRSDEPSLWSHRGSRGWAFGELVAYGGWAGTLVFAGALFLESYGVSTATVGLVLGGVAVAYLPGNFLARRWVDRRPRTLLIGGALVSAVGVATFGAARPSPVWSAVVLGALAFVAGARTIAGSARGLAIAPSCKLQAMSVRTAAVQFGYLIGALVGGAALAAGGYVALGYALGALYAVAAVPHVAAAVRGRRRLLPAPVVEGEAPPAPAAG
jgi:MFS transporter, DHA1 family, inner membrane transport protein